MTSKQLGELKATLQEMKAIDARITELVDSLDYKARLIEKSLPAIVELSDKIQQVDKILSKYSRTDWMDVKELAEYLRLDEFTIWSKYTKGGLPGYQMEENHKIRFDRSEIEEAIRGRRRDKNTETD